MAFSKPDEAAQQVVFGLVRLIAVLILLFLMFRWFEHSQVFHPARILTATGHELGVPFEDFRFKAADGPELHGWFFPCKDSARRKEIVVLVCHGNAGNMGDRLFLCRALLATSVNVLMFDYRGFGRSQGTPSESGTYLDAQAAHRWLQGRGFSPTNILAFGESLGGGVVGELAVRERLCGIVLQSTFTSIPDIGAELFPWLPVRWLSRIKYDTHSKLPALKVPVLVMHGRQDSLVRFQHAERNFAAANEPKLMWELDGDHNDSVSNQALFVEGMEKFLQVIQKQRSR